MWDRKQILAPRRTAPRGSEGPGRTTWGWRRQLATGDGYEVFEELVLARSNLGVARARSGSRTYHVLAGALWIRESLAAGPRTSRLVAGQSFTARPDQPFMLGTGGEGARLFVVQTAGFDDRLERVSVGEGPMEAASPSATPRAPSPAGTLEERAARTNAAQGLGRTQPVPRQARSAAAVAMGFNQHGVNLAPVVPEP